MLLQKQLETKLRKSEQKNNKLQAKCRIQSTQLRYYRYRDRDVTRSRDKWKSKAKAAEKENKALLRTEKQGFTGVERIHGHAYSTFVVGFCIRLYVLCGCSLRSVVSVLAMMFPNQKIPCKSTVSNWLRKSGYYVYTQKQEKAYPGGYALILDESMVIGQERMMMAFAMSAQKITQGALRLADVSVAMFRVRPSWKAEELKIFLNDIASQMGSVAKYVVCDGDSTIRKALQDLGLLRVHDVGHEISTLLRKTYEKAEDFTTFTTHLAQVRFKEMMKPTAYLLPPKARTDARFMNLSHQVKWATNMLHAWSKHNKEEKIIFGFLKKQQSLVVELNLIFDLITPTLQLVKTEGLARSTVLKVYKKLRECKRRTNLPRPQKLLDQIRAYLWMEIKKLPKPNITYHASSDIIESAFGVFKNRKSPNSLNGVTPSVLLIPLMTQVDNENKKLNFCVKKALESVTLNDIEQWNKQFLIPNQVAKRIKTLRNDGKKFS